MIKTKKQNIFWDVIHSVYDIKNVVPFSRKKGKGFISFVCILSLLIILFTSIIPTVRVLTQLHGVQTIINITIPDFTYSKRELKLDYFKCDINEEKNTLFMVDTSRELNNVILEDYSSAFIADKDHFCYKAANGEMTSRYYSDILGNMELSRQWLLDHIYLIYIFLLLVILFSWIFVFISILFSVFVIGCIVLLINKFFIKNRSLKFIDFMNISLYCMGSSCLVKGVLSCFNYTLYLSPFTWYSFIQYPLIGILIFFALKEFKNISNWTDKLNDFGEDKNSIISEDVLEDELGFSDEDKAYRNELREQAKKMKAELKEHIKNTKKDNK